MNFPKLRAFAKAQLKKRTGKTTSPAAPLSSQDYWTGYNVTDHRRFANAAESLAYFDWRSTQYYDYLTHMPVKNLNGLTVLDYGCGPGHDLVGFAAYSPGATLIGMDVSRTSLDQARERLALHDAKAMICPIDERDARLPLESASVDYIHCSGVLHHVPDPVGVLRELRRLLRPDGRMRLMIYNYDSIWLHLFAAYLYGHKHPDAAGLSLKDAFRRITDSPDCPISHAWTPADVLSMAEAAGLHARHIGNAVSVREVDILPRRFEAILDPALGAEHRHFLLGLTFDNRGVPYFNGHAAGLDGCYELTVAQSVGNG
jgi:SAM-dependent methyltransferase